MSSCAYGRRTSNCEFTGGCNDADAEVTYAIRSGLSLLVTHNIADAIDKTWHPEKPSVFYVVDRHSGGLVAKYTVWHFAELAIVRVLIADVSD